jgi:hypothetical protein
MKLFFYELHEGATDLMTDALLVSESDHTPAEFEGLVKAARIAIIDTFEEDTLVEAIARELERSHGFTYVSDEKLQSAMSVGMEEVDTYLVEPSSEFRSIVAEMERS